MNMDTRVISQGNGEMSFVNPDTAHRGLCGEIPLPNSFSVCHAGFVAQEVGAVLPGYVMQEFGHVISQSALRTLCGLYPIDFKWLDVPKPKDERKIMTSRTDEVMVAQKMSTERSIRQRNFGKRIISSRA